MNNGWVTIHRDLLDHDLWLSEKFSRGQAWVDLILLANHKDGFFRCRGVQIKVNRGQCGHGSVALSKRWKWSRGKVIRFLKELESDSRIVQQKNNVTTLITIVKYDLYQAKQNSKRTASRTANGQQTDTNNNDNNGNNGNKEEKSSRFAPPSLTELQIYISEKQLSIDADNFINFYESKNWMVGKNKMKSWKASARGWHTRNNKQVTNNGNTARKSNSEKFADNVRDNWSD